MTTASHEPGPIEALGDLERFLGDALDTRLTLDAIETGAETRGRELLRRSLQAHLDARAPGDVGAALSVRGATGPIRLGHKRLHSRRLVTVFGAVTLTRVGYGTRGHASVHPLDAELCLPARGYSYELSRRVLKAAVRGPFGEAMAVTEEHTGVRIPMRSIELIIKDAAVDVDGFYEHRARTTPKPGRGEILVGAIDCKGIPMVKPDGTLHVTRRTKGAKIHKKKMATVAAVYSHPPIERTAIDVVDNLFINPDRPRPDRPRPRRHAKRVWASLTDSKDSFIGDVKAEMSRRDPHHRHTWVIVTDGERCLQRKVTATFTGVTLILDLIHVLDKIWKAAHVFHPEGSPEAVTFARVRTERILNGQVSQVVKGLRQMSTKHHLRATKAKTIHDVTNYLYANRDRMRYDEYMANGWPIASGSVEGACKNLVRDRFERTGMRWSIDTADALLKLRAVYLSNDFDEHWTHHITQEQQRLHPTPWTVVQK